MAMKKTMIAMPAELLDEVDQMAQQRGQSRSAFIASVLRMALRARRDREITRKLEGLFGDPAIQEEQRRTAADLDGSGTDWADEHW